MDRTGVSGTSGVGSIPSGATMVFFKTLFKERFKFNA